MIRAVISVVVGALAILLVWLLTSVARGARKRDKRLVRRLAPLIARFKAVRAISPDEVAEVARHPELRQLLYTLLSHYRRLDLFPDEFLGKEKQAEATLAYWLEHPNELQSTPAAMEHVDTVRHAYESVVAEFFVFRYRMPVGHWAGTDWLVGLAGPFLPDEKPYESVASGFSGASHVFGKTDIRELVTSFAASYTHRMNARAPGKTTR